MKPLNPDPIKYAIRFRKGRAVLLERENLEAIKRWRLHRKTLLDALNADLRRVEPEDRGKGAEKVKGMPNVFADEDT